MKKIIISIILLVIALVTVITFKNISLKNTTSLDETSIAYRVETNQNLIVETSKEETLDLSSETFTTYLEEINTDIKTLTAKTSLTDLDKKTLKNTFITLTDFIFYNGEIKGKTFADLTTSSKEKVIEIYENIDAKIESVYPEYKDKIKETSLKTYSNIKDKLIEVKDSIASSYKEELGEELYNEHLATFEESKITMQESIEPVIDTIVEESKKVYADTKEKLDNWYQTWKEENN